MGCPANQPFRLFLASIFLCASAYIFLKKKKGPSTNYGASRTTENPGEADPSSLTSKTEYKYDVFLSFRGPDTRTGFVDHLYQALVNVGAMPPELVFRDEENLHYGDHFPRALIDAVMHSKISIPVISKNYASSKWCLRELIHIMKAKKSRGQVVFPIFYKVKPNDVRNLTGKFGAAFHKCNFEEEIIKEGREALREVCKLRVFESDNHKDRHEAKLVTDVVQLVLEEQKKYMQLHVSEHLVGTEDHVKEIMRLADTDTFTDTRIIGIYGLEGVGKTTLAKIIYNQFSGKFGHHSFLKDIRNTSIERLQSQLISDLQHRKYDDVPRSGFEINTLKSIVEHKKVLILLDDVNHINQLDNLIKDGSWSKPGSRIIFTSQEEICFLPAKSVVYHGYQLTEMNTYESLILFSRHAFGTNFPPKEFVSLSHKIIATTGRLPLSLEVIGKLLRTKREENYWNEMLEELRKSPPTEVRKKLELCFKTLEDREQEIFLDIACLFDGTDARIAASMWDVCKLQPTMGIDKLKSRSLVKIGDNKELRMQGQLRDLGRSIANQNGSRICDFEEALKILDNHEGATKIVALHLDKNGSSKLSKQQGLRSLPKLRFLHAGSVNFPRHLTEAFSELKWLQWERCPDSFEPTNICLEKLLILELSSSTHENWGDWRSIKMKKLKVLNLSRCSRLKSTPDLSAFESLEFIILEHCEDLVNIHPSIGNVQGLISLNLRWCGSLEKLPEEVGKLENLEELLLDETNIQEIPPFRSLKKLNILSAMGCRLLTQIPSEISSLVKLSTLNLDTCKILPELPDSVLSLVELKRLSLVRCYMLKRIPRMIGKLKLLTELDLSSTEIMELPESIEELQNLEILRVSQSAIEKLPSAVGKLGKLQELDASGCHNLKKDILIDTRGLSCLKILRLGRARISGLPKDIQELSSLEHLDLLYCNRLESLPELPPGLSFLQLTCQSPTLPSLSRLSYLKELTLHVCMSLEIIPKLPSKLLKLRVWKCHELTTLPDLSNLESLLKLELLQCFSLMEIKGLKALKSLRTLDVSTGTDLSDLDDFEDLESVRYLDLESYNGEAKNIELKGLDELECLEVLNISERKSITRLDLSKLERLKRFIARNCESLAEIQGLDKLESLEELDISGCKSIVTLPDLVACKKLRILEVKYCEKLTEIRGLKPDFKVDFTGCKSMRITREDQFNVDIPRSKSMGTTRDRFKVDIPRSKSMGTIREDR